MHLSAVLHNFGFPQSKVDPDVGMHDVGNVWEYIIMYIDDIIAEMKDPQSFF